MPFSRPSFLFQLSVTEPFRAYLGVSDRLTSTESFLTFHSPYGSLLRIDIVSTWGSRRFASLDRLQFVDPYSRVIPPSYLHVFSDPLPLDANDRPCLEAIDGLVADNLTAAPQEWRQWRPWRTHYRDCSAVRRGSASLRDKTSSLYVLFDVPVMIALMRVGTRDGCEIGVELSCCGGVESAEDACVDGRLSALRRRTQLRACQGAHAADHSVCE